MTTALVMMIREEGPPGRVKVLDADLLMPDGTHVSHVPSEVFRGFEPHVFQLVEYTGDSAYPSSKTRAEWYEMCSLVVQAMYGKG